MTKDIIHVPPTDGFDIVYVNGSFDAGLAGLAEEGVSLWSAEELARLRVQLGVRRAVSRRWSWLAEGFTYLTDPEADILIALAAYNPLLKDPAGAVRAERKNGHFYLAEGLAGELRERASPDPDKARQSGVYRLTRSAIRTHIPSNELDTYALTRFLFGKQAKPYGKLLEANDVQSMYFQRIDADYVHEAKHDGRAFCEALAVDCFSSKFNLYSYYTNLHSKKGRVGGVRPYAREVAALETRVER